MLVPLYGFLEGDTMGLLVLAHDTWTIADVAERLRASARVRANCTTDLVILRDGVRLPPGMTVRQAGLNALECLQVRSSAHGDAAPRRGSAAAPEAGRVP